MARILVIDDNQLVGDTIGRMLRSEGHEVVFTRDGYEGIGKFRSESFAIVICDIFMPDISGLETIREIRALAATVPIIAMTGGFADLPERRFSSDLLQLARHHGASLALIKPFRHEQLMALVTRCLE